MALRNLHLKPITIVGPFVQELDCYNRSSQAYQEGGNHDARIEVILDIVSHSVCEI